jgi:hypothetical protein
MYRVTINKNPFWVSREPFGDIEDIDEEEIKRLVESEDAEGEMTYEIAEICKRLLEDVTWIELDNFDIIEYPEDRPSVRMICEVEVVNFKRVNE